MLFSKRTSKVYLRTIISCPIPFNFLFSFNYKLSIHEINGSHGNVYSNYNQDSSNHLENATDTFSFFVCFYLSQLFFVCRHGIL